MEIVVSQIFTGLSLASILLLVALGLAIIYGTTGVINLAHGEFVMLGKTFKGMTDELLAWQTEQFLAREVSRDGHVVHVRPELVVEIAIDGVQASRRYPGGVALRFARVKGYRDDKRPDEVDTLQTVQAIHRGEITPAV